VNALLGAQELEQLDRNTAEAALTGAGIAPKARAEELNLESFIALSNTLSRSGVRARVTS
jgi:16S rRNA A1518/A1519 N6-dimethyltransferase RsmA/KsgA/DIM1 with predicted DNA glycosylase/AP lyase activity